MNRDWQRTDVYRRIHSTQFRLLENAIIFFGIIGLGLVAVGIKRYFTRGNNPREFLISILGCLLFTLCIVIKRRKEREIMEMCAREEEKLRSDSSQ